MKKVLVVGQTPPPYGGQAISIALMLRGKYKAIKLQHVRMSFSKEMDQIGRVKIAKFFHLFNVIFQIFSQRISGGARTLLYFPAGPNRFPIYRDIIVLLSTRWLFSETIFQFRAAGLHEIYPELNRLERFFFRLSYHKPDLAILLSPLLQQDATSIDSKRICVVPNGLDDQGKSCVRENRSSTTILFVGVIQESKGIFVLLDACKKLASNGLNFNVEIMGKFQCPEIKQQCFELIATAKLQPYVTFLGVQKGEEKWQSFERADILAFPSYFESEAMPRAILEAMHCGLPVVATNWRGIPSLIRHEQNGLLIPTRDADALAQALAQLIKEPAKRLSLGENGREIYESEFTAECFWENMEQALLPRL